MVDFLSSVWGLVTSWMAILGGTGAVVLLGLSGWRWRKELALRQREVSALERQAEAMEKRNDYFKHRGGDK